MNSAQKLNQVILKEVKKLQTKLTLVETNSKEADSIKQSCKELNKERIKALGLVLIQGGKDE